MATYKNIVIGSSLAGPSDDIVRTGALIAKLTGAAPWLVHAFEPTAGPVEARLQAEGVRARLAQQARRTGLDDLPVFDPDHLLPLIGAPAREVAAFARQVNAGLIVLGPPEGGALHRSLGSTTNGVLRSAPCPVLVVRSAAGFPPARVEMPVDFSPVSANAFRQGLEFLRQVGVPLTGAEALFVLDPFELAGSLQFSPEQVERFAGDELQRFVAANSAGDGAPRASTRTGFARVEIPAVLAERKVDLAILGTHGRSGLKRLSLGSVAADVMHRTRCNLLVVPPDARLRAEIPPAEEEQQEGAGRGFVPDEIPLAAGRS